MEETHHIKKSCKHLPNKNLEKSYSFLTHTFNKYGVLIMCQPLYQVLSYNKLSWSLKSRGTNKASQEVYISLDLGYI